LAWSGEHGEHALLQPATEITRGRRRSVSVAGRNPVRRCRWPRSPRPSWPKSPSTRRSRPASGGTDSTSFAYAQSCNQKTFRALLVTVRTSQAIVLVGPNLAGGVDVGRCA